MQGPSERQRWQIEKYMDADLDTVYTTIGLAVKKPSGESIRPSQAKEAGKAWFESMKDDLHRAIRDEWGYADKIRDSWYQDKYNLVFAIGEHIKDIIGLQAPLTVASLLVRFGLETPSDKT